MKKEKLIALLFYAAALAFYAAAIIRFCGRGDTSSGFLFLCLGSSQVCVGSAWLIKAKKNEKNDQNK